MKKINAMLLTDGYKLDHRRQYPEGTQFVYSNWTPRSNNYLPEAKEGVVVFGIQYFIKEYLIKEFNENFFNRPKEEVIDEYKELVNNFLGENEVGTSHIEALHDLGYLPIKIKALPEGSMCPIGVPALTIVNTHPDFFWITNYLETIISNVLWLPMTSATIARLYKKRLIEHANKTGFHKEPFIDFLCHDFSMRGMAGLEASILSSMAHLTSFTGSETIPAIDAIKYYYHTNDFIAGTVPATEHSVMCAGIKENELDTFKRLITKVYPKGFVSIVSDTWDFWKVITEYTLELKDIINSRDGRVVFRPDSGTPEDIICGIDTSNFRDFDAGIDDTYSDEDIKNIESYGFVGDVGEIIKMSNRYWIITKTNSDDSIDEVKQLPDYILKGAYEVLWDIFGGTINEKGYKVLNPKVGIIYGDSITLERQNEIYKRLENKGFCASNLVLGIGSYTYQFKSRDSLGFAMKATHVQVYDKPIDIFKDPKTDNGVKKSLKGLLLVTKDKQGNIIVKDQVSSEEEGKGLLEEVFENGVLKKEYNLTQIRKNIDESIKSC